jgi:hypothetical protein
MDFSQELINQNEPAEFLSTSKAPALSDLMLPEVHDTPLLPVNRGGNTDVYGEFRNFLRTPTAEAASQSEFYDKDKIRAERYMGSDYYKTYGMDPGVNSEERYGQAQTWGDVMGNALGGGWKLGSQTFWEGWKGWGHMANALFSWDASKLTGSAEELYDLQKDQEEIMNKYAIFETKEGHDGIFNREFFGSLVQQSGFAFGAGAQFLMESLMTAGIAGALSPVKLGLSAARLTKIGEGAATVSEITRDMQRLNSVWKSDRFVNTLWNATKKFVPLAETGADIARAAEEGHNFAQLAWIGTGGIKRGLSEFNAAATEARMEAAQTYGTLYNNLYEKYVSTHGTDPIGEDLNRIERLAKDGATDNFIVNTGILAVMNRIEFGNLMDKFSSSKKALSKLATDAEEKAFEVSGKIAGKEATQAYRKSDWFGKLGAFRQIKNDFGAGKAYWEAAKSVGLHAGKMEVAEGVQELLQNSSQTAITDYYTDLYDGRKGSWEESVDKGLGAQASKEGFKTFLMGAVTGKLVSPIQTGLMKGYDATRSRFNQGYRDAKTAADKDVQENIELLNAFYKDPKNILNPAIANLKVQDEAAKGMEAALQSQDRFNYNNIKETGAAKLFSTAIKMNMFDSVLDTIESYGEHLTEEEFKQAFGIDFTEAGKGKVREYMTGFASQIKDFYTVWEDLKDRFAGRVKPEQYAASYMKDADGKDLTNDKGEKILDPESDRFKALVAKRALDEAIEILATSDYKMKQAVKRAAQLKSEAARVPGIGASVNKAFDIIGSLDTLEKEIKLLTKEIKTLEGIAESAELRNQMKEQLANLERIREVHENPLTDLDETSARSDFRGKLLNSYRGYINSVNAQNNNKSIVSESDVEDTMGQLLDYIKLDKQAGKHIQAYNTLVNPVEFIKVHNKVAEALEEAARNLLQARIEEMMKEAGVEEVKEELATEIITDEASPEEELTPAEAPEDINWYVGKSFTYKNDEGEVRTVTVDRVIGNEFRFADGSRYTVDTFKNDYSSGKIKSDTVEFDGKTLHVGEVLTGKKTVSNPEGRWRVSGVKDSYLTLVNPSNSKDKLQVSSIEKLTVEEPVEKPEENLKLTRVHELVRIYPYIPEMADTVLWSGLSQEERGVLTEAAKQQMSDILVAIPKDQLNSRLSVRITPNNGAQYSNRKTSNPYLFTNSNPFNVAIHLDGNDTPVGFLTYGGLYTVKIDGKTISARDITLKDFIRIFKTDIKGGNPIELHKAFVNNAIQADQLRILIAAEMKDKKSLVLSGEKLSELMSFATTTGEFDFVKEGLSPMELNYHSVNGKKYFVSRTTRYEDGGPIPTETVITDAGLKDSRAIRSKLTELDDKSKNLGRYVMAIELPGGKVVYVECYPDRLPEEAVNSLLDTINKNSVKLAEKTAALKDGEKVDPALMDEVNKVIGSTLFLSVPFENKGWYIDVELVSNGGLRVHLSNPSDKTLKMPAIYVDAGKTGLQFKDSIDFITEVNKAIKKAVDKVRQSNPAFNLELTLTPDNMLQHIPATVTDPDVLASLLTTSVSKNIVKNAGLVYSVTPTVENYVPIKEEKEPVVVEEVPERIQNVAEGTRVVLAEEEENDWDRFIAREEEWMNDRVGELTAKGIEEQDAIIQAVSEFREEADRVAARFKGEVLKVLQPEELTGLSVENYDRFVSWVKDNLPDFISVEELKELTKNLAEKSVTVGYFLRSLEILNGKKAVTGGKIFVGEDSPYKYHEAFHAIFRLLLPDNKITQLLDIARREVGKGLDRRIEELKGLHPMYKGMSRKELEERALEEYLADRFDQWKTNKSIETSHVAKSFFARLLEWIKKFIDRFTRGEIEGLFSEIEGGKYKNATLAANRFTNPEHEHITQPALKSIKSHKEVIKTEDGQTVTVQRYLTQEEGDKLAAAFARSFHMVVSKKAEYNTNEELEKLLDVYKKTYDPALYKDKAKAIFGGNLGKLADYYGKIKSYQNVFTDPENRQSLKEAVEVHLRIMGYNQSLQDEEYETVVDELGDRGADDFKKNAYSIGGYGSLSMVTRKYIATTAFPYTDDFGNDRLYSEETGQNDGEPIMQSVNVNSVYNGLLKQMAGITSQEKVIQRLNILRNEDSDTGKFVNKLFSDAGLTIEADGTPVMTQDTVASQVQAMLKDFQKHRVQYLFMGIDPTSEDNRTRIFAANRKDGGKTQVDQWAQAFETKYLIPFSDLTTKEKRKNFLLEKTEAISALITLLNRKEVSDLELTNEAQEISNLLKQELGIGLSVQYIRYSVSATIPEDKRTVTQQKLAEAYSEVTPAKTEDLQEIITAIQVGKPYVKESDSGSYTRFLNMANGNALFDDTVQGTSWKNAEGELVWDFQNASYHLDRITDFNESSEIDKLKEDPFLKNNILLDNLHKVQATGGFNVVRADGLKVEKIDDDGGVNKLLEVNQIDGVSYGSFGPREFLIYTMNLYQGLESDKKIKIADETFWTARHLIRVLEASSTGDLVKLPVIRTVSKVNGKLKITEDTLNLLYNEVVREFDRIRRVKEQNETAVYPEGYIEGYHYETKDGQKVPGRGERFYQMRAALGELAAEIESSAADPEYKLDKNTVLKQLRTYFRSQVDGFLQELQDGKIITKNEDGSYQNNLLGGFIEKGFGNEDKDYGLNMIEGDIEHNVAQIFLNDYLNTLAMNQLLLGDESRSLKDAVDAVKRAKGANGSGPSIESIFTAPSLGIHHKNVSIQVAHIKSQKFKATYGKEDGKIADGQMYGSIKAARYTAFALGKLTPTLAKVLDKMEAGTPLNPQDREIFGKSGLIAEGRMLNSQKLVYYDGVDYDKMSVFFLSKQYTSFKDKEGRWHSRPGMEELHDLREAMDKAEAENPEQISFVGDLTTAKAIKRNAADSAAHLKNGDVSRYFMSRPARYMRLQLENPSNKVKITDPTQAKHVIMSEQADDTLVNFMGVETDGDGNPWTVGRIREMYLSDTSNRVSNNFYQARNDIFDIDQAMTELGTSIRSGSVTPKLAAFQERAVETLKASGADNQLIELFEVKDGQPLYNLNNPITLKKYTQLFLAYFSKGVMSEKVPGTSVALVSNYGTRVVRQALTSERDSSGRPLRSRIVRRSEQEKYLSKNPEYYKSAKKYNNPYDRVFEEPIEEGDFFIDDLRHNVTEYDERGNITGYYTEFMMPPMYEDLLKLLPEEKIPEFLTKMFGVRIPSQDKHSFVNLKLVDFIPEYYGSSAVFPHELIEISGADFDIDKLYIHWPEVFYKKGGKLQPFGSAVTPQEKFDEYKVWLKKNNRRYSDIINILKKTDPHYKEAQENLRSLLDKKSELRTQLEDLKWITNDDGKYDSLFKWSARDLKQAQVELSEEVTEANELVHDLNVMLEAQALREMGLPDSSEEYREATLNKELNNGVLNNRILQQKIALLGNSHMVTGNKPIAFQTAGIDSFKDILKEFQEIFKGTPAEKYFTEATSDVNSLLGKYYAFKNNKEGATNIGPAVNAMLTYSLLSTYGVEIRDSYINDQGAEVPFFKFRMGDRVIGAGYTNYHSYNPETGMFDGERINKQISDLVSVMTDNAKERLAALLGLNISATGYVANMIAQGVPLKTALLLIRQPIVQEYFAKTLLNKSAVTRSDEKKVKAEAVFTELRSRFSEVPEEDIPNITDDLLIENLKSPSELSEYAALKTFEGVVKQTIYYNKVAQVLKLTKGLGTSFEDVDKIKDNITELGLMMTNEEFSKAPVPFDLRQVLTGRDPELPHHLFMSAYIQILGQLEELEKSMFLEKTDVFNRIKGIVKANLSEPDRFNKERFESTLRDNLVSYLGIKAYQQMLKDKGRISALNSLDNRLIYDTADTGYNHIADIVNMVRSGLTGKKSNYLVNNFLHLIPTSETTVTGEIVPSRINRDGITKLDTNTWAKLSEYQVNKLQDSFTDLYQTREKFTDKNGNKFSGREVATALFHYLLVKDGGMYRSGSFIKFIPTFMFRDLLSATGLANDLMKTRRSDEDYENVFGIGQAELFNEFMTYYMTNSGSSFDIMFRKNGTPKFTATGIKVVDEYTAAESFKVEGEGGTGNTITIDLFGGIRKKYSPSKFSSEENHMLVRNKQMIEARGFGFYRTEARVVEDNPEFQMIERGKTEVLFPYVFKMKAGGGPFSRHEYYILESLEGKENEGLSDPHSFIQLGEVMARGVRAVYKRFEPEGSNKQWRLGRMFGELPTTSQLLIKRGVDNNIGELDSPSFLGDSKMYELEAAEYSSQQNPVSELKNNYDVVSTYTFGIGWFYMRDGKNIQVDPAHSDLMGKPMLPSEVLEYFNKKGNLGNQPAVPSDKEVQDGLRACGLTK